MKEEEGKGEAKFTQRHMEPLSSFPSSVQFMSLCVFLTWEKIIEPNDKIHMLFVRYLRIVRSQRDKLREKPKRIYTFGSY